MSGTDSSKQKTLALGDSIDYPDSSIVGGESGSVLRSRGASSLDVRLEDGQLDDLASRVAKKLAPPTPDLPTFGELAADWLTRLKRVCPANERRHLELLRLLWVDDEKTLTPQAVEEALAAVKGLGPCGLNKLRSTGRLVVRDAQARGLWSAPNPFDLVRRRREPRRCYEVLNVAQLHAVEAKLRPDVRRLFRVSLVLGLRPGEASALQKQDVDATRGVITIRRSHGRNTTKTGRERVIPLLGCVAGDVLEAVRLSPSELVFPDADGKRLREDAKRTRALRTAMAKADVGVVLVTCKCRRKGCGFCIDFAPPVDPQTECPRCGMVLWHVKHVRPVRWYDLRHCCATLHRMAGADPLAIKLLLGHAVRETTEGVYTHLDTDWLHRELGRLRF